jgi:hypothetical protein
MYYQNRRPFNRCVVAVGSVTVAGVVSLPLSQVRLSRLHDRRSLELAFGDDSVSTPEPWWLSLHRRITSVHQ